MDSLPGHQGIEVRTERAAVDEGIVRGIQRVLENTEKRSSRESRRQYHAPPF